MQEQAKMIQASLLSKQKELQIQANQKFQENRKKWIQRYQECDYYYKQRNFHQKVDGVKLAAYGSIDRFIERNESKINATITYTATVAAGLACLAVFKSSQSAVKKAALFYTKTLAKAALPTSLTWR